MIIYVDMDGVVADIMTEWLALYNRDWHDCLGPEDIPRWGIHHLFKRECNVNVYQYLAVPGLFARAPVIEGAVKALKELHEEQHDIYFATASPINSTTAFGEKCEWVDEHFPFIGGRKVIGIRDKHLLQGDILIEDYPENLKKFSGLRILFDQPWNRSEEDGFIRCHDWNQVLSAVYDHIGWMNVRNCIRGSHQVPVGRA